MRSKYGEYPEYHTSLDDLTLVTPTGLAGGLNAVRRAIELIENNFIIKTSTLCEPQLGKRGLYPTLSTKKSGKQVSAMMDLITYADGRSLLDIAEIINVSAFELITILKPLIESGLIKASRSS